uniref:Uncharacterized protein LOC104213864 isoform X2 n=1 Tax=Nicotiana sylvestris TaxID=4096 RepID=A0A1U7VIP2_NICSY|nr:PREDICTED: uncharacterized protein LOC104213864 isoform X2 [Nicotiana sylvestris]
MLSQNTYTRFSKEDAKNHEQIGRHCNCPLLHRFCQCSLYDLVFLLCFLVKIMALDKKWMELVHDRCGNAYKLGVESFLDFAFTRLSEARVIRCPCIKCCNTSSGTHEIVKSHLIVHGIIQNYTFCYHHGEKLGEPQSTPEDVEDYDIEEADGEDEIHRILRDLYVDFDAYNTNTDGDDFLEVEPNLQAKKFYRLLKDFEQPLYQNSKVSKLSTMVKLLHIKSIGRWSHESFTMLLKMLKEDLLPDESNLPDSYYEANKIIRDLGLSYWKIDACENNCMLDGKRINIVEKLNLRVGKKIAYKILRYFPLKPRLQRLFVSSKISSLMTWHHDKKVDDGIMRHRADSMAWKKFEELHQSFVDESHNVRLGLASDGF